MRSHPKRRCRRLVTISVMALLILSCRPIGAGETLLSGFEGNLSTSLGLDWQFNGVASAFVTTGATQGTQALEITHTRTQSIPLRLFGPLDTIYATFLQNTQLRADFTVPATANFREAFFRLQVNGGAFTIDGADMILTPGATVTGIWDYKSEGVFDSLNLIGTITALSLQLGMRGPDLGSPVPPTSVTTVDNIRWFAPLPGDFNDNNVVDAADYVIWRENNDTNNPLPNDNGLGVPINAAHYDLWRGNFGKPASGAGTAGGRSMAVPEPSPLALFLAVFLGRSLGRRYR